jgi:quercetin dioxygenase-like cupin family protein
MKLQTLPLLAALAAFSMLSVQAADAPKQKLTSNVYELGQLPVNPNKLGVRRPVFDGPTATLDNLECHVTTLNKGERSGDPRLHRQEEIIIVKEGTVEVNYDHEKRTAGPGAIIYFASNATTFLRNVGDGPATYYVIAYFTPLTPR